MFERIDLMKSVIEMEREAMNLGNHATVLGFFAQDMQKRADTIRNMIDAIDEEDLLHKCTPSEKYLKAMEVVEKVLGKAFREKLSFLAHEALYDGK